MNVNLNKAQIRFIIYALHSKRFITETLHNDGLGDKHDEKIIEACDDIMDLLEKELE